MGPMRRIYRTLLNAGVRLLNAVGLNVAKRSDYYSPLPLRQDLAKTRDRWDRPSGLVGVHYEIPPMRHLARELISSYYSEYDRLPKYESAKQLGYGPGFTTHDAWWLYAMLRKVKPKRYVEVGAGLSTWYALQAAQANAGEGSPCELVAVDPHANDAVSELEGLRIVREQVQSAPLELFTQLESGDVLFIDSTHVVKLDGDVPHLYLEVIPRLAEGVWIHAHDIHFPYNVPHPAEQYLFKAKWPLYWTEAMLLQAFLAFNRDFQIAFSPPLLRHFDEGFLSSTLPGYQPMVVSDHDTHTGSIWLRRLASS